MKSSTLLKHLLGSFVVDDEGFGYDDHGEIAWDPQEEEEEYGLKDKEPPKTKKRSGVLNAQPKPQKKQLREEDMVFGSLSCLAVFVLSSHNCNAASGCRQTSHCHAPWIFSTSIQTSEKQLSSSYQEIHLCQNRGRRSY